MKGLDQATKRSGGAESFSKVARGDPLARAFAVYRAAVSALHPHPVTPPTHCSSAATAAPPTHELLPPCHLVLGFHRLGELRVRHRHAHGAVPDLF
jgi:hypothetical protein